LNRTRVGTAAVVAVFLLIGCERDTVGEKSVPTARELAAGAERQIEKSGAVLDDATITAKIKTALIAEPGLKGLAIDVDTSGNVVSLTGTVGTAAARERAEEIARKTDGVKEVRNNLAVKAPS
jgi:hyperosmotically inducible periplasmic protein